MYFSDLSLCHYHPGPFHADDWKAPLHAIGWLEHPHAFARGDTPPQLIQRLEAFIAVSSAYYPSYAFRGAHQCSLCHLGERVAPRAVRSHENLWIPGDRVIYIAPGAITHYVGDHHYQPPDEFTEAVLKCPDYGSDEYQAALQAANLDIPPPLLTLAQAEAEFQKWREDALMLRQGKKA